MTDCEVCLYADLDGSSEFFRKKDVRARKDYECSECERPIPKGTVHQYASGKCEGDMWDARTCLDCAEIRATFYCEGEMYGMLWPEMQDYAFEKMTTGCLNRLKSPSAKAYLVQRWNEWKFEKAGKP